MTLEELLARLAELSALTSEELAELEEQIVAWYSENREAATTPEQVAELSRAAEAVQNIRAEQVTRAEAQAELAAQVAQLDEQVLPVAETPEGEGETPPEGEGETPPPAEGETPPAETPPVEGEAPAEEQPTAVAAGGAPATPARPPLAAANRFRPSASAARPRAIPGATIVAAADIPGFATGAELRSREDMVRAFVARMNGLRNAKGGDGEFIPVFTVQAEAPSHRRLGSNAEENMELIANLQRAAQEGGEALLAAGGLCAPAMPYYEQQVIAVSDRPLRDALAGFQATRGGITLMPPPHRSDVASGVAVVTAAQDAASAAKPCVHVACPSPTTVSVEAISRCIEFGNFNARSWPEQVAALLALSESVWASTAETAILDGIATASTAVTAKQGFGAARQIVAQIGTAAARFRNTNRMSPDAVLRVLIPAWVEDMMRTDLVRSWHDDPDLMAVADAVINSWFANLRINRTEYLDPKTGGSNGMFAAQTAGTLKDYPGFAYWYIFAEGSFLHLDGGTLDFGLVRDSTLNAANNYRIMAESFENVAFVGVESVEVRSTVLADGTYAPAGSAYSGF